MGGNPLTSDPVIEFDDLSYSYDHQPVVQGVSFTIQEHDFVSVVGPNGGGKTTLLKLVLGLLHPTRGSVRVFGVRPEEARRRIGYMPQHAHLDPQFPVTVMDVVLMGRIGQGQRFGFYSRSDRDAARNALNVMGMSDRLRTHFSALSGGQRQRVLIARALACEPDLLLLDEPTAGLDFAVESDLYDLLKGFSQRLTVVMVSHDLGFVSRFVNKVVCVKRNAVVHPTCEITGEIISEMYGSPMKMVRHDQENQGGCHKCLPS
jgi:zinc transport system ATP-binding protein